ncbi:chorismate mutase [Candidatus Woesearchaeota archaeon]|nr:chorismate mutase [Candidatus Woesearchaeota archaeon]
MDKLKRYRKSIDYTDKKIVKLLLLRFDLAKKVSKEKKLNRVKIIDKKRESEIMKNIKKYSNKKHQQFVKDIFKNIINYSRKLQR